MSSTNEPREAGESVAGAYPEERIHLDPINRVSLINMAVTDGLSVTRISLTKRQSRALSKALRRARRGGRTDG